MPALTPDTIPVDMPTDATPADADDQVPPVVPSVNALDCPVHSDAAPTIADGGKTTVTVLLAEQPLATT